MAPDRRGFLRGLVQAVGAAALPAGITAALAAMPDFVDRVAAYIVEGRP